MLTSKLLRNGNSSVSNNLRGTCPTRRRRETDEARMTPSLGHHPEFHRGVAPFDLQDASRTHGNVPPPLVEKTTLRVTAVRCALEMKRTKIEQQRKLWKLLVLR